MLLREEIKDQQTLAQSTVATVAQSTGLVSLSQSTGLHVPLSMSSQSANNINFQTPLQGVKQSELKSASSIAKSSEVNLAGAKFTSDVSQSKLLEIVSRSNRLMQWASAKPAEHVQPVSSVQTTTSGSTGFDRRLDGNSNCVAREPYGDTKLSGISSSVPQFIQQQAPMDMPLYMRSQLSWMHPQNLSSHATSQGGVNSMLELPNSTTQSPFNCRQIPMGADTSQSQKQLWKSLPSKQPSQQTSEFSNSIPPDLNVEKQSPRSPVRQSSGMLVDSQPDLALQL